MKKDTAAIVKKMKRHELETLVLEWIEQYPELDRLVALKAATPAEEVSEAGKVITSFLQQAKGSHGMIFRGRSMVAKQGFMQVLGQAENRLAEAEWERAGKLALKVLGRAVDALSYMDDSDGVVMDVSTACYRVLETAAASAEEKEAGALFDAMLKEAANKRYDGWPDFRFEVLRRAVPLAAADAKRKEKLWERLAQQEAAEKQKDTDGFWVKEILHIRAELMEAGEGKAAAREYRLAQSRRDPSFLLDLAEEALEQGWLDEADELLARGRQELLPRDMEKLDWLQVSLYGKRGETQFKKALLRQMMLGKYQVWHAWEAYEEWKMLHAESEWEDAREELLEQLPEESELYLDICLEEKRTGRIMDVIRRRPDLIRTYYPHVQPEASEAVKELFQQAIAEGAERAQQKKHYRALCRVVLEDADVNGIGHARQMIAMLRETYPLKSSLQEELDKTEEKLQKKQK
ncbi:hypothetical protein [Alkalicoccus chagannorensis]|uniref:hypothetical protein n=1 Tax=Alkalicoccus chagannorensis TaxID=427072 RepID=UPI000401B9C8|nr:hypothetical protein [Alkalicoccus chagannorensis]